MENVEQILLKFLGKNKEQQDVDEETEEKTGVISAFPSVMPFLHFFKFS